MWLQPQALYELNQAFKSSLALFYSASLGSLQTALRNLEAKGLVAFDEVLVGRRAKKVYRLLDAGRAAFLAEFQRALPPARLEDAALCRVHFLGLLPHPADRRGAVELIVGEIEVALAGLEALSGHLASLVIPESARTVFHFQTRTLDYGLAAHRAGLAWFQDLQKELEGEP